MLYRALIAAGMLCVLAGCFEGQKPSPLARPGPKPTPVTPVPPPTGPELLPLPGGEPSAVEKPPPKPSLYERLGKAEGIAKVVDDFFANVIADDNIRDVQKKHFKEGDVAGLKKKLIEQIGEATGGPEKYTGKSMKEAHKGQEITNKEFDALLGDLDRALEKNNVSKADRDGIRKMLETMRKDVVEKPE